MPEFSVCRERILSENYFDFIVNQLGQNEFEGIITEDTCQQETEFIYQIFHIEREKAEPLTSGRDFAGAELSHARFAREWCDNRVYRHRY